MIEHQIPKGYEGKGGIRAAVLAKSIANGITITTFLIDFPRFILAELNTHRAISKNGASSRAIPVAQQIKRVQDNPVVPIHFGLNQAGMSADTEVDVETKSKGVYEWLFNANRSVVGAQILQGMGVHKQVVNRIMEPYSFMRMVVTATEWDNFFWLRLHKDADPHIAELARVMLHAYQKTRAAPLDESCWHTPFFGNGYWTADVEYHSGITAQQAIEHSMSCCAQTSYRKLDMSTEKTEAIVERLFNGERSHASPSEHIAQPMLFPTADILSHSPNVYEDPFTNREATHVDYLGNFWSNNFKGWHQYRDCIPNNVCTNFDFNTPLDTSDIKSGIDMV